MAVSLKPIVNSFKSRCSHSHCNLCSEYLRGAHSQPGQWRGELQQFHLCSIPQSSCVCKADELSIRRGQFKEDNSPRWIQWRSKKQKALLCTWMWCGALTYCLFASYDSICAGVVGEATSPFLLCFNHYYRDCSSVRNVECTLCSTKCRHHTIVNTLHTLYMSLIQNGLDPMEWQKKCIDCIRKTAWSRIESRTSCQPHLMHCGRECAEHLTWSQLGHFQPHESARPQGVSGFQ